MKHRGWADISMQRGRTPLEKLKKSSKRKGARKNQKQLGVGTRRSKHGEEVL